MHGGVILCVPAADAPVVNAEAANALRYEPLRAFRRQFRRLIEPDFVCPSKVIPEAT